VEKTRRDGIKSEIFGQVGIHNLLTELEQKQLQCFGHVKNGQIKDNEI
jgi:hypothetical protein